MCTFNISITHTAYTVQVYGYMWQRLEGDIALMSEHLQAQLKDCHEFLQTLLPMFKYVFCIAHFVVFCALITVLVL